MANAPILSICIPIYNRLSYLERILSVFIQDKCLFEDKIHLLISDNCSTEDIKGCVDSYKAKGLRIEYNCNEKNLGAFGNFVYCYTHTKGEYCWLYGSDDVPLPGLIATVLETLIDNKPGLLFINHRIQRKNAVVKYTDINNFLVDVNYWITFMSVNIFQSINIKDFDYEKYRDTHLSQVILYLRSATLGENCILFHAAFDKENDANNNGGYNLFKVFVLHLLSIFDEYRRKKIIRKSTYKSIKYELFNNFLTEYIRDYLIFKKATNMDLSNAWRILFQEYKFYFSFYSFVIKSYVQKVKTQMKNVAQDIKNLVV